MNNLIEKVICGSSLSVDESYTLMNAIMRGEVNNSLISALLTALKIKGESAEEIAGFVQAMKENSLKVECGADNLIDVCGTGGDSSGTFNISTATAFVVAAAGYKVAKHGNRSISSKSGSADVLRELGVDIELTPELSRQALEETGITFLFAPMYHPAMKYVMPVRKELAMKTVFNLLGPLTNPASTKHQIVGTYNNRVASLLAEAQKYLDMEKILFICTDNKYDEVLLKGRTIVFEYVKNKGVSEFALTAESFGYSEIDVNELKGSSPQENAGIILDIFQSGEKESRLKVVAANAALALYAGGYSDNLIENTRLAEDIILSGKALSKLNELKEFGKKS